MIGLRLSICSIRLLSIKIRLLLGELRLLSVVSTQVQTVKIDRDLGWLLVHRLGRLDLRLHLWLNEGLLESLLLDLWFSCWSIEAETKIDRIGILYNRLGLLDKVLLNRLLLHRWLHRLDGFTSKYIDIINDIVVLRFLSSDSFLFRCRFRSRFDEFGGNALEGLFVINNKFFLFILGVFV